MGFTSFCVCFVFIVKNCANDKDLVQIKGLDEISISLGFASYRVVQVRHSRYPATYTRPAVNKEAYEDDKLPFDISKPVKAARCEGSSSTILHDPLVK